ncbi:MAG: hypothetical protein KGP29_05145 [Proteobacteria bacterium]|nr:hypothetical protein [Pseudomonadota bacterium]
MRTTYLGDYRAHQYISEIIERLEAKNPTLQSINLDKLPIGASAFKKILGALGNIEFLSIRGIRIGDSGVKDLAVELERNTTLKSLDLADNDIKASGGKDLAGALRRNITLEALNLSGNEIGVSGAEHLAGALKINRTLTSLNLRWNKIGDEGARHLSDVLKINTTLESLYFFGNEIGDAGAEYLADVIKGNMTLTTIELARNKIGKVGAGALLEVFKKNTTLTTLNLQDNEGIEHTLIEYINILLERNRDLQKTREELAKKEQGGRRLAAEEKSGPFADFTQVNPMSPSRLNRKRSRPQSSEPNPDQEIEALKDQFRNLEDRLKEASDLEQTLLELQLLRTESKATISEAELAAINTRISEAEQELGRIDPLLPHTSP